MSGRLWWRLRKHWLRCTTCTARLSDSQGCQRNPIDGSSGHTYGGGCAAAPSSTNQQGDHRG